MIHHYSVLFIIYSSAFIIMVLTQPLPILATPRNQPQAALANYTTLARSMQPILTTPVLQDESQPKTVVRVKRCGWNLLPWWKHHLRLKQRLSFLSFKLGSASKWCGWKTCYPTSPPKMKEYLLKKCWLEGDSFSFRKCFLFFGTFVHFQGCILKRCGLLEHPGSLYWPVCWFDFEAIHLFDQLETWITLAQFHLEKYDLVALGKRRGNKNTSHHGIPWDQSDVRNIYLLIHHKNWPLMDRDILPFVPWIQQVGVVNESVLLSVATWSLEPRSRQE